jgi:hypothetical protein
MFRYSSFLYKDLILRIYYIVFLLTKSELFQSENFQ